MEFKKIGLNEASELMYLWEDDSDYYLENKLDPEYREIRQKLLEAFDKSDDGKRYALDYKFGLYLKTILGMKGFSLRDAADDGTWRFLSLCVVPDLVERRWGKDAEIRYYKQSGRIWLKTIWWYIYLSWQGDEKETAKILVNNSTDQILQLVDRSGTKGYYTDVYRRIMYYYWFARENDKEIGEAEFRKVMTLHTALCKSIEPELFKGGSDGYVRMLFTRIGVELGNE